MSSLIGIPGEHWSLARAIDALASAARQVGKPGLIWLLGVFYPGSELTAAYVLLGLVIQSGGERSVEGRVLLLVSLGLFTVIAPRVSAGLARVTTQETWAELSTHRATPRLRDVWRAGRGLGWPTFALWLNLVLMLVVPSLVVLAPPLYILEHIGLRPGGFDESDTLLCALVLGPFAGVVLAFGLVISVLYQLALQSLAHNQRGVNSALLHAWRIVRHDPWATARAVLVDFVAGVTLTVVQLVSFPFIGFALIAAACCVLPALLLLTVFNSRWLVRATKITYGLLLLIVPGLIGVVRAAYWSRVYRALGGLAPSDSVPGLSSKLVARDPA